MRTLNVCPVPTCVDRATQRPTLVRRLAAHLRRVHGVAVRKEG